MIYYYRYKHFDGHRQPDSHELIRYLLDGMKTEETEVSNNIILLGSITTQWNMLMWTLDN